MDVDTGSLRAFVTLSEELHFGRAAAQLGVTQQALSKRIAKLEADLAGPLIDRTDRRRLRLTPLGHELLPLARTTLEAADRLIARTAPRRRLRVDTMGEYLAPHHWVYRAVRQAGAMLDVVTRPAEATADHLLLTDDADFAFGRAGAIPRPWPSGLQRRCILFEPLSLVAPAAHPWAGRTEVTMAELGGETLWFPLAAAPIEWRSYLADLADSFGLTIETTGSTFGYQRWLDDITAGRTAPSLLGDAMTPPDESLVVIPIVSPTPVYPWSLLWTDRITSDAVEEFLRHIGFPHRPPTPDPSVWLPAADRPSADA